MTLRAPIARVDWEGATLAAVVAGVGVAGLMLFGVATFYKSPFFAVVSAIPRFMSLHLDQQLVIFGSIGLGGMAGWIVFSAAIAHKVEPVVHSSGGRLREGASAARAEIKKETELSPTLFSVAGLDFTQDRIRRSLSALGSTGAGKTQFIWSLIAGFRAAGFRMLIVDGPKGDYSQAMPGDPLIISPWHRGPAWDIAADCPTRGHARELARSLIPVSEKDPLWGSAAGMILTAILCKLQSTCAAGKWGWGEIYDHITLPVEQLQPIAAMYYPPALQALQDAESKTTQSIMINLTAFMGDVFEMALAWRNSREKFSFTEWWSAEPGTGPKVVILQGSAEFQSLASGYISSVINTLSRLTASPSFPESKTRRNVVIIDEMAQLQKLQGVEKFLEIGRSKGACAVFATQSPAQLRKVYGQDDYASWMGMIGTKAFLRTVGADDLAVVMREIGEREVFYQTQTTSGGIGDLSGAGAGSNRSITTGWQRERVAVVREDQIKSLGPKKHGVELIMAGFGADPILITVPYTDTPALRPAIIDNPAFNQPVSTTDTPASTTSDTPSPADAGWDEGTQEQDQQQVEQEEPGAAGGGGDKGFDPVMPFAPAEQASPGRETAGEDETLEGMKTKTLDVASDALADAILGSAAADALTLISEISELSDARNAGVEPVTASAPRKRKIIKKKRPEAVQGDA